MNIDRRQQIKDILFRNDRTVRWLMGKVPGTDLYYLLNGDKSKSFDIGIYDQIMDVFRKEGMIVKEGDECLQLLEQTMQMDSLIGHALNILNHNVKNFTEDRVLNFHEKKKLYEIIENMRNEFNDEFDEIIKIFGGL